MGLTGEHGDVEPLSFALTTLPANGVLSGIPPMLSDRPDPGFTGSDSFELTAEEPFIAKAPARVSIQVHPLGDLDGDPDVDRDDLDIRRFFEDVAVRSGDSLGIDGDERVTALNARKLGVVCLLARAGLLGVVLARPRARGAPTQRGRHAPRRSRSRG